MSRFAAIILLLFTGALVTFAQESAVPCNDTLTVAITCFSQKNLNFTEDYTSVDNAACNECFTNNNFYQNFAAFDTCDGATGNICKYFTTCNDVCYPKINACQQELYDYYVCVFGAAFAPKNCTVKCEGSSGNGNGSGSGSGGNNTTGTSGVSVPTAITASSSIVLLVVAGLLL
jgi:hypothetical protein